MNEIKPIETTYSGHLFRSRLEARFALFFDILKIKWEYEKEGYETPYGLYLPDFWLPDVIVRGSHYTGMGTFVECKPDNFERTHSALEYVGRSLKVGGILARGFNPNEDIVSGLMGGFIEIAPGWDAPMNLYICSKCKRVRFDYSEYQFDECERCKWKYPEEYTVETARREVTAYRFW